MFAVGDEKQSIYSFQGAEPKQFDEMRSGISRAAFESAEHAIRARASFKTRSARRRPCSSAVDTVFAARGACGPDRDPDGDRARGGARDAAPGLVELWPLIEPDEQAARSRAGTRRSTTRGDEPARCGSRARSRST